MFTRKTPIALGLVGALVIAGCTDSEYGPGGSREKTATGAGVGALVGAVAGVATAGGSNKAKNAAIGAAIGAGLGAAIGADLDRQAAELRNDFSNGDIQVINTGSELIVRMPQDILFDVDSDVLQPNLQADLRTLASHLDQYPNSIITVEGHTDNTGSAAYNQDLSQRRAQSVVNTLIANGVSPSRLVAVGKGENEPVADNLTEEGRHQNRRVEVIIRPTS